MLDLSLPQMTPGELKFALLLEHHLNSLPDPEYRQVVVESLMVVSLVASSSPQPTFGGTLVVEHIINHARDLFLQDQVNRHAYDIIFILWYWCSTLEPQRQYKGPAVDCCCDHIGSCGGAAGICVHFYDSAPSGRYGTMSYIALAVADRLRGVHRPEDQCKMA